VPGLRLLPLAFAALLPLSFDAGAVVGLQRSLGGWPADPLPSGDMVYVPNGRVITVLDYADPDAPVLRDRTDTQPTRGFITSLTQHGAWLYASYDGFSNGLSGVAVFSLADPAHPQLVGQYEDFNDFTSRDALRVLATHDRLYLFDGQNGIYVSDLADPSHPVFTRAWEGFGPFHNASVDGDRLYTVGRNFLFQHQVTIFDLADPDAPAFVNQVFIDGATMAHAELDAPLAVGFGWGMGIVDISDPATPVTRGFYDDGVSTFFHGAVQGSYAYGLGGRKLEIYDIADLDAPVPAGSLPIDTYLAHVSTWDGSDLMLTTRLDRILRLGFAVPTAPVLRNETLVAGGSNPFGVAFHGDKVYVLGNDIGIQVADAQTLEPESLFETSLPPSPTARAFEDIVIDQDVAYLASWGSGLVLLDVSTPGAPEQLSHFFYEFASAVAVEGNTAYVGRTTNGGEVIAVDVSDPTNPTLLGAIATTKAMRLRATPSHVFVADARLDGDVTGGLRILDVTDPSMPTEVSLYDEDCLSATDLELSEDGDTAYVACETGLHIVDVSAPAEPVRIGALTVGDDLVPFNALAVAGNRAWYGTVDGVAEIDIGNPETPTLLGWVEMPVPPRAMTIAPDGRVFVAGGMAGLHVLGEQIDIFADGFEPAATP
jgi:hypothetical protein